MIVEFQHSAAARENVFLVLLANTDRNQLMIIVIIRTNVLADVVWNTNVRTF